MCGFAGWFDRGAPAPPPSPERCDAALAALALRGPDGEGRRIDVARGFGLLHRRLAVVDLEGGAQPMRGPAPGEWICWNGEVFDHAEWARRLTGEGVALRTRSDTEVLAHLLARHGVDAFARVSAQYALAWIGGGPPELLLARDSAGEKPLYWTERDGRVWFASTFDALLALVDVPARIDREALSLYLSWGFVPAPLTIFEGVRKLEAGAWMRVRRDGGVVTGVVARPAAVDPVAPDGAVAALRERLTVAARRRLLSSDVPVGVFLSGGLDSLAVTAVLRDTPHLRTFTVRARDAARDESDDAARVARALGVDHTVIDPPPDDPDHWRTVLNRFGEPFGSTSALAVDAVARAAKEHVTVVLTGDGGDEALGGYPRHVLLRRLGRVPRLPTASLARLGRLRRLRRAAELLSLDPSDRYAAVYEVFGPWRAALTPDDDGARARDRVRALFGAAKGDDLSAMLRVDRALELADSHCVKVDVACMGNGVEPRAPWLDRDVVALCDALPARSRISGGETKRVLRALVAETLPADAARHVLTRPKRGFTTGFEPALRSPAVRELLLGGALARVPGLETAAVTEILDQHAAGQGNHLFRLGVLVGLALFAERLP